LRVAHVLFEAGFTKLALDALLSRQQRAFMVAAGILVLLAVIRAVLVGWWQDLEAAYESELGAALRTRYAGRFLARPFQELNDYDPGSVGSRLTSDIQRGAKVVGPVYAWLRTAALGVSASVYIIYIDWQLGLPTVLLTPLVAYLGYRLSQPLSELARRIQQRYADIAAVSDDSLANLGIIRAFELHTELSRRFEKVNQEALQENLHMVARLALLEAAVWFCASAPLLVPLVYGGYLVLQGTITGGAVVAVLYLTNYTRAPIAGLGSQLGEIRRCLGAAEDVLRFIERGESGEETPVKPDRADAPNPGTALIKVDGLTFGYGDGAPVLSDIDLELSRGSTAFLVGESGSGKSTLMKLLGGLLQPPQGSLSVGPIDLGAAPQPGEFAVYVPQEPYLFPWTVRENLCLACPGASDAALEEALNTACADYVHDLPAGLETMVGERGVSLSGGQQTRLSIARALLAEPELLLLDEPSASIDAVVEQELIRRLRTAMADRTLVVSTHRLWIIEDDDLVFVLDGGRLVQQGRHRELVAQPGPYQSFHRQSVEGSDSQ